MATMRTDGNATEFEAVVQKEVVVVVIEVKIEVEVEIEIYADWKFVEAVDLVARRRDRNIFGEGQDIVWDRQRGVELVERGDERVLQPKGWSVA